MANGNNKENPGLQTWEGQPQHIKDMFGAHGGRAAWEEEAKQLEMAWNIANPAEVKGQGYRTFNAPSLPSATPIPEDHPGRTPAYQHPDVHLPGYKPWEDYTGYKRPDSTPPVVPSAPITPSVADWQKTATSPWGGTIQFTPGGAVYRVPEGRDAAWMQANQDYLMREGFYLNPEQFGQHMGIDIYEPGYVPGTYSPTQGVDPSAFSQAAWDAVDQYPGQKAFRDHVRDIQIRNQQQAMIEQMALDMYGGGGFGGGFGGGGTFGGGFGGGIPPVVETGAYPTTPVFTGEPSFAGDPTPSDPFINLAHAGLGALASSAPAGTRDRLRSWLAGLGYTPQGVFSGYGESEWKRPEGQEGPAAFTDADFNTLTDPSIQKWIRWLMGKMGYSTPTLFPGAVAP